jgi:type I restriction enzyme S subunit
MNAEQLLAHFERISEAPDAISRLRRFILDLAVRGKLVEQDPEDEHAAELLRLIECEKKLTKRNMSGIRSKDVSSERIVDAPFDIPNSWEWVYLGQILLKLTDGTHHSPPNGPNGEFLYITAKNIKHEGISLGDITYVTKAVHDEIFSRCNPARGDILYVKDGATTGVVAINNLAEPFSMLSSVALLKVPGCIFNELLIHFLRSPFFYLQMRRLMKGGAIPRVTLKRMAPALLPLPPRAEQHRIVAKVDDLMTLCGQLEAARQEREKSRDRLVTSTLQRLNQPAEHPTTFRSDVSFALQVLPAITTTPAQIKQLRQMILNLAVRGKLVEQAPEDEPAEELLASFAEAKVEQRKRTGDARIKLEDDPSSESFPWPLPVGWMCQSFQNLCLFIDYRGNTPPKTNVGVPLITAKNVRMGRLAREPQEFLSQTTFEKWMTRGFPRVGDIFFTTEAPLGNVCLNDIKEPFALAQRVICLQPYADINTKFIMFALMSDLMQSMIGEHATGLTAKGIKAAKLKPLPIPIPPLAEQHRIVAKVDELMALCDQLEYQLSQANQDRRSLLETLLFEALNRPAVVKT